MSKDSHKAQCILYVCCGSKCKKRGGKQIYRQLKNSVKEKFLKRNIQVIKTGCTDRCKMGPVITVMPDNEWHFHQDEKKTMLLLKHITVKLQAPD
jgi:NADH:ubiquinone oxidoreductase subunit E